jgi:ArsR family transcriptional regulator, arsenate/arsenite/antimonite-responsive transcriptional repressor
MSNYDNKQIDEFAQMFKALANPNRLRIFLRLMDCCRPGVVFKATDTIPNCVGKLGEALDIGAPTVSHHIKELRQAGLIRVEHRGQNRECWVDENALPALIALLAKYTDGCKPKSNTCEEDSTCQTK